MSSFIIDTRINASKVVKGAKEISTSLLNVSKKAGKMALAIEKAHWSILKMVGGAVMGKLATVCGKIAVAFTKLAAAIALALVIGLQAGMKNLAQFNNGLNPTNEAITGVRTELLRMKNALATAFQPILTLVTPALTQMISLIADAITKIGMLFAALRGQTSFTKAVSVTDDYAKSLKKTGKAAKDAKKQLAGIYDLNNIQRNDDSASGGGGATLDPNTMFETVSIDSQITAMAEKIRSFVDAGKQKVSELWQKFTEHWFVQDMLGRFESIKETFSNFVANLKEKWAGFVENLSSRKDTIGKIWDAILKMIQLFAIRWQAIIQIVIGAIAPFAEAVGNIINHVIDTLGGLVDFVAGVFTGDWKRAWSGICNVFIGIVNVILDAYEGFVNMLIGGINAISIDMPEWMGGKHIGFDLAELHIPRIPRLAEGTVVPRQSREFAAILGDNNRETEVVSPLSTMKQAMIEALREVNIVGGGTEVRVVLEGDAKGVFNMVRTEEERYFDTTGNMAFVH